MKLTLEEQLLVLLAAKAWPQVPGETVGIWFTQYPHSWSSLWLAERGFLHHPSDWPVISLQPAEAEGDAVTVAHLSGAGASHISLMNSGHFAHGGFDLRAKRPSCWTGCWPRQEAVRGPGKDPLCKEVVRRPSSAHACRLKHSQSQRPLQEKAACLWKAFSWFYIRTIPKMNKTFFLH